MFVQVFFSIVAALFGIFLVWFVFFHLPYFFAWKRMRELARNLELRFLEDKSPIFKFNYPPLGNPFCLIDGMRDGKQIKLYRYRKAVYVEPPLIRELAFIYQVIIGWQGIFRFRRADAPLNFVVLEVNGEKKSEWIDVLYIRARFRKIERDIINRLSMQS